MIERLEYSSRQIPIRTVDANSDEKEKRHRNGKFEAKFIVYNIKK